MQGHLFPPADGYGPVPLVEANDLLRRRHYLGATTRAELVFGRYLDGELVAAQVYARPTSRHLPPDGTWWELTRWCLTPEAGDNAGSRMHAAAVRHIKARHGEVTTLVSYSDPAAGHTGALYRACNWKWAPTWQRLRPPPTGNGQWVEGERQEVKDRWVFTFRRDGRRPGLLMVRDAALNPGLVEWDGSMRWGRAMIAGHGCEDHRRAS